MYPITNHSDSSEVLCLPDKIRFSKDTAYSESPYFGNSCLLPNVSFSNGLKTFSQSTWDFSVASLSMHAANDSNEILMRT